MKLNEIDLELIIFILREYQKEHPSGQLSELLKKLWKELGEMRDRKYSFNLQRPSSFYLET